MKEGANEDLLSILVLSGSCRAGLAVHIGVSAGGHKNA